MTTKKKTILNAKDKIMKKYIKPAMDVCVINTALPLTTSFVVNCSVGADGGDSFSKNGFDDEEW